MLSKRRKCSVVNSRNVRAKFEEENVKRPGSAWIWFYKLEREKMKSANIDGGNDLNTIGEKDLMEHVKEKYHSLSDSEMPQIMIWIVLLKKKRQGGYKLCINITLWIKPLGNKKKKKVTPYI
ncbi:hypothetical protein ACJIZ3_005258 [Penstemon smallii]|uniref:Uncharacterized protein n=1 Tax=Penstemon smallii TaxID=265156 RepID=A0ABD3S4E9_9LAMI